MTVSAEVAFTSGPCSDCVHFRPALSRNSPLVSLSALADSAEPEVYEELKRIAGEEHDREQTESQKLMEYRNNAVAILSSLGYDYSTPPEFEDTAAKLEFNTQVKSRLSYQFVREPLTVTHCSLDANRGVFYIAEIRNWAQTCGKYVRRSQLPICRKCVHYQASDAERKNRAETANLISGMNISERDAAGLLSQRASEINRGMAHGKAHDLRTAYNAKGRLQGRLAYLPFCEVECDSCRDKPSLDCTVCGGEGAQVVQPEIFNRFLGCQVFAPSKGNSVPRPQASPPEAQAPNDGTVSMGVDENPRKMPLRALGLSPFSGGAGAAPAAQSPGLVESVASHAVGFVFDHIRDFRDQAMKPNASGGPVDDLEIAESSLDVLVQGTPPLTNEMLRRSVAIAKALVPGAPGNFESDYSQFVGSTWRRNMQDVINMQLRFIRMYPPDAAQTRWHTEASQLFKEMASAARSAAGQKASSSPSPARRAAASMADTPGSSVSGKTCKAGHPNATERIFCVTCGKPLMEKSL